jgi:hypothetical protein
MTRGVVHMYSICWNEAPMLGFYFRHYDRWVDRYFIGDDGSDDGTRAILEAHPKVEILDITHTADGSFVPVHTDFNNQAWKRSRGQADWVVLADIDEHYANAHQPMQHYLAEQRALGVTLIPGLGFDMISPRFPTDEGLLVKRVRKGVARKMFNKLGIFDPNAIDEVNTQPGRHLADPTGQVLLPARDEVTMRHFKFLSLEYWTAREALLDARRSQFEVDARLSHHYRRSPEDRQALWDMVTRGARPLVGPTFEADQRAEGPLWWEGHPRAAAPERASS